MNLQEPPREPSGESPPSPPTDVAVRDRGNTRAQRDTANHGARLVHAFIARNPGVAWPSKVKSDLMVQATVCVQDGIPDEVIARGLDIWHDAGYPASTLPNSIMHAQRAAGAPMGTRPRKPSPSERAAATLALADQLEQETDHGHLGYSARPREITDRR